VAVCCAGSGKDEVAVAVAVPSGKNKVQVSGTGSVGTTLEHADVKKGNAAVKISPETADLDVVAADSTIGKVVHVDVHAEELGEPTCPVWGMVIPSGRVLQSGHRSARPLIEVAAGRGRKESKLPRASGAVFCPLSIASLLRCEAQAPGAVWAPAAVIAEPQGQPLALAVAHRPVEQTIPAAAALARCVCIPMPYWPVRAPFTRVQLGRFHTTSSRQPCADGGTTPEFGCKSALTRHHRRVCLDDAVIQMGALRRPWSSVSCDRARWTHGGQS
jgi:hypothetical protein